jgi:hypothetical protein
LSCATRAMLLRLLSILFISHFLSPQDRLLNVEAMQKMKKPSLCREGL